MTASSVANYFKKRLLSFKYAWQGIKYLIKTQANFQIHLSVTVVVFILGIYLRLNSIEWSVLILTTSSVWISEAFNTALEELVNLVSPEWQKQAGLVKDIAAGAVLLSALMAIFTGFIIFLPKIF